MSGTAGGPGGPGPRPRGRTTAEGGRDPRTCGCDEAIERLFEYLDAELPEPECLRLAAHIAVCDGCSDAATAERHVRELIRRTCVESAPEALRVRVVSQLTVWQVGGRPDASSGRPPGPA